MLESDIFKYTFFPEYRMSDIVYTIMDTHKHYKEEKTMQIAQCDYSAYSNSRQFLTREEKVEMLKEYQQELEQEAKGVAERINELQKAK